MELTPPPTRPATLLPPVPVGQTDQTQSFLFVAITTAIWVTAASVALAMALAIVALVTVEDIGADGWGVVNAMGIGIGVGILGGYVLFSIIAMVRKRSQIGAVLAGIAIAPGLIGTAIVLNVVSDAAETARQDQAELILSEFKKDFGIDEGESSYVGTRSLPECTSGRASSTSLLVSDEAGFELITKVEATLVSQGWETTTGVFIDDRTAETGDEEVWAIAGIKDDEAIVFDVQFWIYGDGTEFTRGTANTYAGSCVKEMEIADFHPRIYEMSRLPKTVPDRHD